MNAPRESGSWRAAVTSLRNRQYRWLYASNMAFFLAMGGQSIVRQWIAFELTGSELALGIVGFAMALPMLLVGPVGGVFADRYDRRLVVMSGQSVVVTAEGTVLLLLLTGQLEYWHLVVASTAMGSVFPLMMPARQAIVVNLVGKRGLPNAMALSMAGMNVTRVLGPSAAAASIGVLGVAGAYSVGVALFAVGLTAMWGVGSAPPTPGQRDVGVARSIGEGVAFMRANPLVLSLLFFGLAPMFLAMPFQTLLVVFAEEVWAVGETGLAILSGVAGLGGVAGSFYLAWSGTSPRQLRQMMASMLLFGGSLFMFAQSPLFWLALPLVFVANVFSSIFGTVNNTSIQILIPDHVRGRISSLLMMSFALPMLGTLPMSAVAELYGAPAAVSLAALLATGVALAFYALSTPLRGLDRRMARAMEESL